MKKVLILLFLLLFSIYVMQTKSIPVSLESLRVHLEEGEAALYFLSTQKSDAILLETNATSVLLGIRGKREETTNLLKMLGKKDIQYDLLDCKNKNFKQNGIEIEKEEQNYLISFLDKKLYIYQGGTFNEYPMTYLLKKAPLTYESLELAFYPENLEEIYTSSFAEHWIDAYQVSGNDVTVVKFTKDTYHVTNIPYN